MNKTKRPDLTSLREKILINNGLKETPDNFISNKINFIEDQVEEISKFQKHKDLNEGVKPDHGFYTSGLNPQKELKKVSVFDNNLEEKPFKEQLREYDIIIESRDRDTTKFPNPFEYKVYFNNTLGNKDASIPRIFEKVKYAKLDLGILPRNYFYTKVVNALSTANKDALKIMNINSNPKNSSFSLSGSELSGDFVVIDINDIVSNNNTQRFVKFCSPTEYPNPVNDVYEYIFNFPTDQEENATSGVIPQATYPDVFNHYSMKSNKLTDYNYLLLNIDELENANENATNNNVARSFSVMFQSSTNQNHFFTTSKFNDKVFSFDTLAKISKLSIRITDEYGNTIKNSPNNYIDYNVTSGNEPTSFKDENHTRNYDCCSTYFRHPYYKNFQNTLILKLGVYEMQIQKKIFT